MALGILANRWTALAALTLIRTLYGKYSIRGR
jgi:hypothetical protein